MKFSVVIPTRGDVDLTDIIASYDGIADEVLVWDNSKRTDLSVYGRYAMIEEARNDVILTQDDDCIISDPEYLVAVWEEWQTATKGGHLMRGNSTLGVVCNMPSEFRHDFYRDHALVGFGAVFHRDAPCRAFGHLFNSQDCLNPDLAGDWWDFKSTGRGIEIENAQFFRRTCDIVFTALTPRVLVDVPKTNLWWAEDETRMYRQPQHIEERTRMLDLVRKVRDAG